MTYHIFIGYDDREHIPYQVAKYSLEKNSKVPIKVHKLQHRELRKQGLLTREWTVTKSGQLVDNVDGRPFSTEFTFSRFLVPELWRNLPDPGRSDLVMFVDCDFIWRTDISEMFSFIEQEKLKSSGSIPVYVVPHDYNPNVQIKMDGMSQSAYNMKLWAAMMVFDMSHTDHNKLTPDMVNTAGGRDLMNFFWLKDLKTIGFIPEKWHFVPNHSEKNTQEIAAIHYTEGGPWFKNYRNCRYGKYWLDTYNDYLKDQLLSVKFNVEGMIDGD